MMNDAGASPVLQIAVIGAGASGALATAHLLRQASSKLHVTLIEPRDEIGRGLAYSTGNPRHLLNVRAENMSAFADDSDHFWRWLSAQGYSGDDRFRFVPRSLYGRYLGSLLTPHFESAPDSRRLSLTRDRAVGLTKTRDGVTVELASGGRFEADIAILACGHEEAAESDPLHVSPWIEPTGGGAPPESVILILGTGLTMVDVALSLRDAGHSGPIVAVSRRGLLPQAHRRVDPMKIEAADRPSGADLSKLSRWLRLMARERLREGGDWRSVIDGLRPHVQTIWHEMPVATRRRFLEHLRPWWDTHRHRMAPEVATRLQAMIAEGRLEIVAGKIVEIVPTENGAHVSIRRRGDNQSLSLSVSRIVSCRGVTNDPRRSANPIIARLLADGLARADALAIGLDVGANCAVVDAAGRPSDRLFAIGPMSQAAFWEITAIPDIRLQAAELAARLNQLASNAGGGFGASLASPRLARELRS